MDRLGIDIGSKTAKVVLIDEVGELVFSDYLYHRSKVQHFLLSCLKRCLNRVGDREITITVTGSAGMRLAELFDIPFVQEVVALKEAVESLVPEADAVLEMGGEDTKLLYLRGVVEQRMNTVCAGGTGGFIDMMAGLMGVRNSSMQQLALGAEKIYPVASRCAVFAKSDVRPLLNAGVRKEDIAASVLEAVCTQAVAGLSAGRPLEGTVLLLGGPFHHIPYLRDAFCHVSGIESDHAIIPQNSHLFVAHGAALSKRESSVVSLSSFIEMVERVNFSSTDEMPRLPALFKSENEYSAFKQRHNDCTIPRGNLMDCNENLFIGIDAGSTTMKIALVNEAGELCAYRYEWNEGDVSKSFPRLLKLIYREFGNSYLDDKIVRRSCIVGYGEEFCQAAYKIDMGQVETVAHLRAAQELEPNVDFLIDIGGQDIKCFYVEDGLITDIVLNEACSSGCGSLFDSTARSMRYSKESLSEQALFAHAPVDLGSRCTTFMDSRIKHAQKEGAEIGDIAAGVCYATARNALLKVVRKPNLGSLGRHIVVQGGAFANDALLRAFEMEANVEVSRPDIPQIMGAWGAALLARDEWLSLKKSSPELASRANSTLLNSAQLDKLRIEKSLMRCSKCANHCTLSVNRFKEGKLNESERLFVTGNRCERGLQLFGSTPTSQKTPPNMISYENKLLNSYDKQQPDENKLIDSFKIGIPKVLALYESYPFWHTFFTSLGFEVVPSAKSSEEIYRKGISCIPAEGSCYPSKIVYGHCVDLVSRGADLLFLPKLTQQFAYEGLLGREMDNADRECPFISEMHELVRINMPKKLIGTTKILSPDFSTSLNVLESLSACFENLGLNFEIESLRNAWSSAKKEYERFFQKLENKLSDTLKKIDGGESPGALLLGHSYHLDPGINHAIDELLEKMGYAVLSTMTYKAFKCSSSHNDDLGNWHASSRIAHDIETSESRPGLRLIHLRSFGCGIDAVDADIFHERIKSGSRSIGLTNSKISINQKSNAQEMQGRIYAEFKIDQIFDLAAVRIRLRSLDYAMKQRESGSVSDKDSIGSWSFMSDDEIEQFNLSRRKKLQQPPSKQRKDTTKPIRTARSLQRERLKEEVSKAMSAVPVVIRDSLINEMERKGFLHVRSHPEKYVQLFSIAKIEDTYFIGPEGMVSFKTWEEIDRFLQTGKLPDHVALRESPPMPAPAGSIAASSKRSSDRPGVMAGYATGTKFQLDPSLMDDFKDM